MEVAAAIANTTRTDRLPLRRPVRLYVLLVTALGVGPLVSSTIAVVDAPPDPSWLLLVVLTILSGALYIRVPSVRATVSVSDGFVFASALLFGPAAATLTVALDGIIASCRNRDRSLHHTLFNLSEPAVSVWTSSQLYYWLSGASPIFDTSITLAAAIVPIIAMTTTYYALNTGLTALAVALETAEPPVEFIRKHLPHVGLSYFASISLLLVLVPNASSLGTAALGVTLPLLLMSYVSSKTAMTHIEASNRHLSEMHRLYVNIVETLAVAIDAKDQVTHSHIRRVQAHAVALARALGVRDEREIRAIEAAGLLHDLGKLAVPEHILNKPGPLTSAELEQMKSHASVGAAILSTIDFPYPVVPIVRHHHEAWDGSGYPDGLAGEAIPLGARILAVVDCFDALTSDRPYRRRLPDDEALRLIVSRRGRMYDPAVVDTFMRIRTDLPQDIGHAEHDPVIARILGVGRPGNQDAVPALATRRQAIPIRDLEREAASLASRLDGERSVARIGDAVAAYVAKVVAEATCVLFVHDADADEVMAAYVSTTEHRRLLGHRLRIGDGVSGWVAATQDSLSNADAALDLGDAAATMQPRLRTCVAVPLDSRPSVLTVYTCDPRGFSTEQVRLLQLAARHAKVPSADGASATLDLGRVCEFPRVAR